MPLPVWRRKITIRVKEDSIEEIVIFRMYLKENLIMKYIYIYTYSDYTVGWFLES